MATPWFSVATHFKGVTEVHGAVHNPTIVEFFRVSGHPEIKDDETPWCAAFVGACLRLSGYRTTGELGARSYLKFGQDLGKQPQRGCIVVFWRDDPNSSKGHVAFYDRDDGDNVIVLGGNQGNAVSVKPYPKSRVLAYRWPTDRAPLPTDTTLPNIMAIDPTNAPPDLIAGGAAPRGAAPTTAVGVAPLAEGSQGPEVRALQAALSAHDFPVGKIDGDFGPNTRTAVAAFQRAHSLPATGTADQATLQALAAAPPQPVTAGVPISTRQVTGRATTMGPDDILRTLFGALINRPAAGTGGTPTPGQPAPQAGPDTQQILQLVLRALMAQQAAGGQPVVPSPESPTGTAPPVLSFIDKILGGEALAGKKTPLAVLAYTVLAILQSVDVAGTATGPTATPTGSILTTLIAAFGGMGVLAKIDRVVQMLGVIAAKPK